MQNKIKGENKIYRALRAHTPRTNDVAHARRVKTGKKSNFYTTVINFALYHTIKLTHLYIPIAVVSTARSNFSE